MNSVCEKIILDVLPTVTPEDAFSLVQKLISIGVESVDDLSHVTEMDLVPPMNPIQARKLMAAWRHSGI